MDVCYYCNGIALSGRGPYAPCTGTDGPSTVCTALNRDIPPWSNISVGTTTDHCLPNGLCQNRHTEDGVRKTRWYVDYCIDPTYNVGGCPNFCASKSSEATVQLTPCTGRADSDRWCCGISKDRCTMNIRVLLRPQVFSGDSSVSQSASLSPTVASTSTESSAPTGSTEPAVLARQRLSGGAIAGIVIGTTVGLILLGTVMFTARRGIRRTGPEPTAIVREPMSKQPEIELDGVPKHVYVNELPGARPSNLPGVGPVELERR